MDPLREVHRAFACGNGLLVSTAPIEDQRTHLRGWRQQRNGVVTGACQRCAVPLQAGCQFTVGAVCKCERTGCTRCEVITAQFLSNMQRFTCIATCAGYVEQPV